MTKPASPAPALFGKARLAALHALLVDPGRAMHLREIAREGGIAPSAIARELDALIAAGVLLDERSGKLRLFRANPASTLLPALRSLTRALADLEPDNQALKAAAAPSRRRRAPKSEALGLSAPYDWSNARMPDPAFIAKTAASLRFEDVARLCAHYGVAQVRQTLQARLDDPLTLAILARQLRNIEAAMPARTHAA